MSTSAKRAEIRRALIDQGFRRGNATHDSGDGNYGEMWGDREENMVVISWAPRTSEEPETASEATQSSGLSEDQIDALSASAERFEPADLHPRAQRR